jgi:autotransporter-associated beta strand protein
LALFPASLLFAALAGPSLLATDLYWDVDGATSNGTVASGNWNGTNAFWNTDSSGAAGGSAFAVTTSADNLFFSAGTTYKTGTVVTFSGTAAANSLTIEEGPITVGGTGGILSLGAGGVTFGSGTGASHVGASSGSTFGIALQANTVFTTNNTATATSADAAASQSINGSISGSFGFTKTGAGNLVLRGASTYTGATIINQGSIFMGGSAVLGSSTGSLELHNTNTTLAGNHVRLTLNGAAVTKGSLSGTVATAPSGTNRTIIDLNNRALTINQTTNGTYGGEIINSPGAGGSFTLGGLSTARLTLAGGTSYTGATVISAGTLEIGSTGTINGTSGITVNGGSFIYNSNTALTKAVTVNNGGTVGGTKSVAAVTINAGGSVSPGDNGVGTFTAQSLTWNSNDTTGGFNFDLGLDAVSSDKLTLTGAFTKGTGGTFVFNFNDVGVQSITYTLITFGSTTFTDASVFSATGVEGTFALVGNTLTFTAVPEPSTYAMIAGVLALGGAVFRRRRI